MTAIWTPETAPLIEAAAADIPEDPRYAWTHDDVAQILGAAGAVPAPAQLRYWTLKGQAEVLFQAVPSTFPGAKKLVYPKRSKTPRLSILSVLREENLTIPMGMVLEVPVKLKQDADGLVLAAALRMGKLRATTAAEYGYTSRTPAKAIPTRHQHQTTACVHRIATWLRCVYICILTPDESQSGGPSL